MSARPSRLFRLLLYAYPPGFRARFGQDMARAHADKRAAVTGGLFTRLAFDLRAGADAIANGLDERRLANRRGGPRRAAAGLMYDVRHACRAVARRPSFAIVSITTLALGIGANSAVFSIANTALVRPLPIPQSEQIVNVGELTPGGRAMQVSFDTVNDWRRAARSLEAISPFVAQSVNLTGTGEPDRIRGGFVSSDFFQIVRVPPVLGRTLVASDDAAGAERVTVLDYGAWQRRFGGNPNVIGRRLALNGEPFTLVGVMPRSFVFPVDEIEAWLPIRAYPNPLARTSRNLTAIARVRDGMTVEQARAEFEPMAARLQRERGDASARGAWMLSLQALLTRRLRPVLRMLAGIALFTLLIACANVAGLQLGRASSRQRELAVRAALGAGRGRIVRQLVLESIVLGVVGGAAGLVTGDACVRLIAVSDALPLDAFRTLQGGGLDWRVAAFTLAIAVATGVLAGIVPAMRASRLHASDSLKAGVGSGDVRGSQRARATLVVVQIAVAVVLLTGAGLAIRSFARLARVDPGFDPDGLLTLEYRLPRNKYPGNRDQLVAHERMLEAIQTVPGVRAAALTRSLPFSGNGTVLQYDVEGRPGRTAVNTVTAGYFAAMDIPLLRGRTLTDRDRADRPIVTVVSASFARQTWGDRDPIGRTIHIPEANLKVTVVGVVGDAKTAELTDERVPALYASFAQNPGIFATLVVRTDGDPLALASTVKRAIWSVDPDQPVWKVRTLQSLVDASLTPARSLLWILSVFGLLALLLASVGLYGVISFLVGQRTREIGVRVALGAAPGDIFRLVIGRSAALISLGLAIGTGSALVLGRTLRQFIYGVSPSDPASVAGAALVLVVVSLAACAVPARRALRIQPAQAMRES